MPDGKMVQEGGEQNEKSADGALQIDFEPSEGEEKNESLGAPPQMTTLSASAAMTSQAATSQKTNNADPSNTSQPSEGFISPTNNPDSVSTPSASAPEPPTDRFRVADNIRSIMSPNDTTLPRLSCFPPNTDRYSHLRTSPVTRLDSPLTPLPKYFFALDLSNSAPSIPRLFGTIVQVMKFLGPQNCALSIVEGRSADGTAEILAALDKPLKDLGVPLYNLSHSDLSPKYGILDRIEALSQLRNQALEPLTSNPSAFASDALILFLNDITVCPDDLLELVHQHVIQDADMVCALDWINDGDVVYDAWVGRGMTGDLFFEVPLGGNWNYAKNLFWNDPTSRERADKRLPLQVYSCWHGVAVIKSQPFTRAVDPIRFRRNNIEAGECYMAEPTILCRDLWRNGYGKIAVVPSVAVGYESEPGGTTHMKELRGTVRANVEGKSAEDERIAWDRTPPGKVKCVEDNWSKVFWTDPV